MKKLLIAIVVFIVGAFSFSAPSFAITCNPDLVNQCGPMAGCDYGQKCNYDISGNYGCFPSNGCPAEPDLCGLDSVAECINDLNLGAVVGTSCPTSGGTCQYQSVVTGDKCICKTTPNPTPSLTPTPTKNPQSLNPTPTPIPALSPIPSNNTVCSSGNIYPPNSDCYADVEVIPSDISLYPLSCIPGAEVSYESTTTSSTPMGDSSVTVPVTSNLSEATLGFLGPSSNAIGSLTSDQLAKNYLFNSLFDRPNYSSAGIPREVFRTYWRMLNSRVQANLKAIFLSATRTNDTKLTYYYLDENLQQQKTDTANLYNDPYLPSCLKDFPVCDDYYSRYNSLHENTKIRYDTLLPFDFGNSRAFITLDGNVSKESIPYLKAIYEAIQGDSGLLNFYTPDWAIRTTDTLATVSKGHPENSVISSAASISVGSCPTPEKVSSVVAPKTYPNPDSLTQSVTIPLTSELVESTPGVCKCKAGKICRVSCNQFSGDQSSCIENGCVYQSGSYAYRLTGSATSKFATVLNNPLITSINSLIIGSGEPEDPSFYRMMVPSFAPAIDKEIISAPQVGVTSTDANTTITNNSSSPIYRENNLSQTAMHLLQNCWFVPSDQQSSSKCGSVMAAETTYTCADCSQTPPDTATALALKTNFVTNVTNIRWLAGQGQPAVENFETVVSSAVAAGVDPVFALAIWFNESNASNYEGVCLQMGDGDMSTGYCNRLLDFGINLDSIASNYSTGEYHFQEQLEQFLALPNYYKSVCQEEIQQTDCPMRVFAAKFAVGTCTPSSASDQYLNSIKYKYSLIAPDQKFPCYPTAYP